MGEGKEFKGSDTNKETKKRKEKRMSRISDYKWCLIQRPGGGF